MSKTSKSNCQFCDTPLDATTLVGVYECTKCLATFPKTTSVDELIGRVVEAIGWAYADCCATLDNGGDPRKAEMSSVLERAIKDLSIQSI